MPTKIDSSYKEESKVVDYFPDEDLSDDYAYDSEEDNT